LPSFETLLILLVAASAASGALLLVFVLGRQSQGPAVVALSRGDFAAAREAVDPQNPDVRREERLAAAVACKHLLDFDQARAHLASLLGADPADAEVALELGLIAAYGHDHQTASRYFDLASKRPDLWEALTLHRAWLDLDRGQRRAALSRFEEVEATLESKLRFDLGEGDPEFSEWFLQAGALWHAAQLTDKARWASEAGARAAPESLLVRRISPPERPNP